MMFGLFISRFYYFTPHIALLQSSPIVAFCIVLYSESAIRARKEDFMPLLTCHSCGLSYWAQARIHPCPYHFLHEAAGKQEKLFLERRKLLFVMKEIRVSKLTQERQIQHILAPSFLPTDDTNSTRSHATA